MTANLEMTRLSEKLGLTPSELAKLVGIARNTLTAKSATRKVDAVLRPIARILATATEMAGDESRAAIWSAKARPMMSWPTWRLFAPASMLEPVHGDPDGRGRPGLYLAQSSRIGQGAWLSVATGLADATRCLQPSWHKPSC